MHARVSLYGVLQTTPRSDHPPPGLQIVVAPFSTAREAASPTSSTTTLVPRCTCRTSSCARSTGAGSQFRHWDLQEDGLALRSAKLLGFPSPLPAADAHDAVGRRQGVGRRGG